EEADMYERLITVLEANGLHHYEISNFAKPGFESRHNHLYWRNDDYYGLGAGAHSYIKGVRRVNAGWTKKYIRLINESNNACVEEHTVPLQEKMEEEMFLGLRETIGVSRQHFQKRYGQPIEDIFGDALNNLTKKQLIKVDEDRITLTKQGVFLGNEVFQEFIT